MTTLIDTPSTDLVVQDADVTNSDSDNEGTPSVTLVGAAALAAGIAIGTYVVPPVVGFVKSWFAPSVLRTDAELDKEARIAEIVAETPKAKKAV